MADVNTGGSGLFRVTASVSAYNAAELWWDIAWSMWLIERVSSGGTYNLSGTSAQVAIQGVGVVWSGSFTFDWRPSGLQSTPIASGTTRVYAPPSGSGAGLGDVTGSMGSTGTYGAGGPASATVDLNLPTLTTAPDAPSDVTATRISDTSILVEWTPNPDDGQPYDGQSVWVSIDDAAAVLVASATAAAESYPYAAAANHKYVFTVKASNGAGTTASAPSNTVVTTPAALGSLGAAVVSAGVIRLTLPSRPTPHTGAEVVITETHDGGATWNAKATIPVSSLVASGTTTWDDTAAEVGGTVQYRAVVRTTIGTQGVLSSVPVLSSPLVLNTPPNAPTGLTTSGPVDASRPIRLPWTHNPSSDGASQSSRKIEYSTDGGATSTSIVAGNSTVSYYDWTPSLGSFTAGQTIMYRVATAGSQPGTYGVWSQWQTITLYGGLAVTLVADNPPAVHGGGPIPVAWESSATWGTASQTQYQVTATDQATGQVVFDTGMVASTDEAIEIPASVQVNGHDYLIEVTLRDNHQVTSSPASRTCATDFLAPGPVAVTWSYDDTAGQLVFYPEFSDESSSAFDDTAMWTLERSIDGDTWSIVGDASGPWPLADPLVRLGADSWYRTTSYTALGVAGEPTVWTVPAADVQSKWAWLNYGPQFGTAVRFGWRHGVTITPERPSESYGIEGVDWAVALFGEGVSESLAITTRLMSGGDIPPALATSTAVDLRTLAKFARTCVFRDADGEWFSARVYGMRISPERKQGGRSVADASFTVERVAS